MTEIAMKVYKSAGEILVAACDSDLLGKTFKEGNLQIEIAGDFYDDIRADNKLLIQNLSICTVANLVGEKTINYAVDAGFVDSNCIIYIDGIPHAQFCTM
jgi:hypothetical protein